MQRHATTVTAITEMVPIAYMVLSTLGTVLKIEYGPHEAEITAMLQADDPPERATLQVSIRPEGVDFSVVAA